jgi:glycosyltransferase involved in cell wall biosynthesis
MAAVTVLMSVFNGMPYLPEAVESILNQTFQDFRFLIINDGSNDGSREYLDGLEDHRVQIVHQVNGGLGSALNTGLAACQTEFIARMDADDISLAPRLEEQVDFLKRQREIGLVGGQISYFIKGDRNGWSPALPCLHERIYKNLLNGEHAMCHATMMCRTTLLKQIGGYRITGVGQDLDMFLRMGEVTRLGNLGKVLLLCRTHSGSANTTRRKEMRERYAHAIHCAQQRAAGSHEVSFDEFLGLWRSRPLWKRVAESMDVYASYQYRLALTDVLGLRRQRGYARMGWAALCSPVRTSQRILRAFRKLSG